MEDRFKKYKGQKMGDTSKNQRGQKMKMKDDDV